MRGKPFNTIKNITKIGTAIFSMLLPGILIDIFYWFGGTYWSFWRIVVFLQKCHITYSKAFEILSGSFGVIISMLSMFLTISNYISERFEKKIFGIPRAEFYEQEVCLYKYLKRMCLSAPVWMLLFLNINFCISGYLIFCYCISFLLWHYYRHTRSFYKPLDETVIKLCKWLPKDEEWTKDTFSEYQILLEAMGNSAEEEGNWKEMEMIYDKLLCMVAEYRSVQQYLICYYFYQIIFWNRNSRSHIVPMRMMRTYIEKLDMIAKQSNQMPEEQWPILWGMMRAAVYEAEEEELINFLQYFFDYKQRSVMVLRKTGENTLELKCMEEQTGMLLVLLEYRFGRRLPEKVEILYLLQEAWEWGSYAFLSSGYNFISRIFIFNQNLFENDQIVLETAIENLKDDYCSQSRKSLIANIVLM